MKRFWILRVALVRMLIVGIGLLTGVVVGHTQTEDSAKHATPSPTRNYYYWDEIHAGYVCGAGATRSLHAATPTFQCGGIFGGPLYFFEAGVMGPMAKKTRLSGYLSSNMQFPLLPAKKYQKMLGVPLAAVGYTRFFEVGHSIDYGLAYAFPIDNLHALQVEVRDYRVFSNPDQHNVVLRVAWLLSIAD